MSGAPAFAVGENCVCMYQGKPFAAKITKIKEFRGVRKYVVHYPGWKKTRDEQLEMGTDRLIKGTLEDYYLIHPRPVSPRDEVVRPTFSDGTSSASRRKSKGTPRGGRKSGGASRPSTSTPTTSSGAARSTSAKSRKSVQKKPVESSDESPVASPAPAPATSSARRSTSIKSRTPQTQSSRGRKQPLPPAQSSDSEDVPAATSSTRRSTSARTSQGPSARSRTPRGRSSGAQRPATSSGPSQRVTPRVRRSDVQRLVESPEASPDEDPEFNSEGTPEGSQVPGPSTSSQAAAPRPQIFYELTPLVRSIVSYDNNCFVRDTGKMMVALIPEERNVDSFIEEYMDSLRVTEEDLANSREELMKYNEDGTTLDNLSLASAADNIKRYFNSNFRRRLLRSAERTQYDELVVAFALEKKLNYSTIKDSPYDHGFLASKHYGIIHFCRLLSKIGDYLDDRHLHDGLVLFLTKGVESLMAFVEEHAFEYCDRANDYIPQQPPAQKPVMTTRSRRSKSGGGQGPSTSS